MGLYLEKWILFSKKSIQGADWPSTYYSTLLMALENFLPSQTQILFWLLLLDRLNTRNLLRRKNFNLPSYNCELPGCSEEESLEHLFQTCPFANKCWDSVCPQRCRNLSIIDSIKDIKDKLQVPFSMEIIILASWSIWIVRINNVFNNQRPRFACWKAIYKEELRLLKHKIRNKFRD
jgi:hypothetical protein